MFLPVLLVRDYGPWAWVVFAVPNVVGAAAMGWTIDAQRSREIVAAHRPAITAFSIITIAYQLFFATWALGSKGLPFAMGLIAVAAASLSRSRLRAIAVLLYLASIACWCAMAQNGELRGAAQTLAALQVAPSLPTLCLLPACLFGFLLCPYLDSTFHAARQQLDPPSSRAAFGVGFGIIFFSAIILSLLYASHVATAGIDSFRWIPIYWMLQLGFTIGAHAVGDDSTAKLTPARTLLVASLVAAAGALVGRLPGLNGESVYRCFLGFYGLCFPAYVWICMMPARGIAPPTHRALAVCAVAVLIAAPMFWLAFLDNRPVWICPAVAIPLLARLAVGGKDQQNSAPTSNRPVASLRQFTI